MNSKLSAINWTSYWDKCAVPHDSAICEGVSHCKVSWSSSTPCWLRKWYISRCELITAYYACSQFVSNMICATLKRLTCDMFHPFSSTTYGVTRLSEKHDCTKLILPSPTALHMVSPLSRIYGTFVDQEAPEPTTLLATYETMRARDASQLGNM